MAGANKKYFNVATGCFRAEEERDVGKRNGKQSGKARYHRLSWQLQVVLLCAQAQAMAGAHPAGTPRPLRATGLADWANGQRRQPCSGKAIFRSQYSKYKEAGPW